MSDLRQTFPPSEFIQEEMEARGWSKETLADRTLLTVGYVEALLANKRQITRGVAMMLGKAFETGPEYWSNLQKAYDDGITNQKGR